MGIFIPVDSYMLILEEVGRWKVVGMKKLFKTLNLNQSYSFFCRQIRKLELEGYLRSIPGPRRRKFLTLTERGGKITPYNAQFEESDAELNHDLITANVIYELNKFETLGEGHVLHDTDFFEVEPDGLIYINRDGLKGSLAVEIELTQKAKPRIVSKFSAYKRANCFNYCLYIFNKEPVFNTYKRQLENMNEEVRGKILLMCVPSMTVSSFHYLGMPVYFRGEFQAFEDIFSNSKD